MQVGRNDSCPCGSGKNSSPFMNFIEKVLNIVAKIPAGQVLTYKEVARRAGRPRAYRAVGNILNKNNNPMIPCHRVIRFDGKLGMSGHTLNRLSDCLG